MCRSAEVTRVRLTHTRTRTFDTSFSLDTRVYPSVCSPQKLLDLVIYGKKNTLLYASLAPDETLNLKWLSSYVFSFTRCSINFFLFYYISTQKVTRTNFIFISPFHWILFFTIFDNGFVDQHFLNDLCFTHRRCYLSRKTVWRLERVLSIWKLLRDDNCE